MGRTIGMAVIPFIGRLSRGETLPEPGLTPQGFEGPHLPEADVIPHPENGADHPAASEAVGQRAFVIRYRDHAGQVSARRIVALEVFEADGGAFLKARCVERQALRNFRVDRIEAIAHGVTGEDLGPPDEIFRQALAHPVRRSPSARAAVRYALRALMTVARADGVVSEDELDVIEVFLEMALPDASEEDIAGLVDYAAGLAPSFETFLHAVDEVALADAKLAEIMAGAALTLAKAHGSVEADEADLVDDMAMILKAHRAPA
ncbi:WYL domain-containing protein [Caulobacter sp. KR2-114]|uniref:WYL domain-containing protein n=1 Tax=Caulobacter sp. KR2-114 TaxID=3400912 RepID=UPI003C0E2E20